MPKQETNIPKFRSESAEADWWASAEGRAFVKRKSKELEAKGLKPAGSKLVARMNREKSASITMRLSLADIERARKLAGHKGIAYETLLKQLVHEGLERETRRRGES
jgi:predicted DNA binding CopG/RHH family protein